MQLILCSSFLKQLKKIGSIQIRDIKKLLIKYPEIETGQIVRIGEMYGQEVLKCYLLQKKIRLMTFFRIGSNVFIPFGIVKKESNKGQNIRKDNLDELFSGDILRVLTDLQNDDYQIEAI